MYANFFKRIIDFILSLLAIIVLSPVLIVLIILGAIKMKGNPFFIQLRPGRNNKIFRLIKFRTMSNEKDKDGNLLPDDIRLNRYGKFLRSTSLDELPELFTILSGKMAVIGPRPLLVKDMVFMTDEELKRHTVRPGLSGLAQISGRNAITWKDKYAADLKYIEKITFFGDAKIILLTFIKVFKREGISSEGMDTSLDYGDWLLEEGMIDKEYYGEKIKEAKKLEKEFLGR